MIAFVVVIRNPPWGDKDRDMRNKGKRDKDRDIQINEEALILALCLTLR